MKCINFPISCPLGCCACGFFFFVYFLLASFRVPYDKRSSFVGTNYRVPWQFRTFRWKVCACNTFTRTENLRLIWIDSLIIQYSVNICIHTFLLYHAITLCLGSCLFNSLGKFNAFSWCRVIDWMRARFLIQFTFTNTISFIIVRLTANIAKCIRF